MLTYSFVSVFPNAAARRHIAVAFSKLCVKFVIGWANNRVKHIVLFIYSVASVSAMKFKVHEKN